MSKDLESVDGYENSEVKSVDRNKILPVIMELIEEESDLKTSTLVNLQSKGFVVAFWRLENLKEQIDQEMERHNVLSRQYVVEVTYANKNVVTHDSWERFNNFNTSQPDHITEIVLTATYSIKGISSDKIERYTVLVALRCDISKGEADFYQMFDHDDEPNNVRCSCTFVDYVIGKNIFHTITQWVDSLETINTSWHIPKLQRFSHRLAVRTALRHVGYLAVICFAYLSSRNEKIGTWNIGDLVDYLLVVGVVFTITSFFIFLIGRKYDKYISKTLKISSFDITNGDKERLKDLRERNKGLIIRSAIYIILGILAVPGNVLASYIYDLFK